MRDGKNKIKLIKKKLNKKKQNQIIEVVLDKTNQKVETFIVNGKEYKRKVF